MFTILMVVQVFLAIGVIVLVLIQHGKGADMGAAFGAGASATVFGSQGSGSFLTRATAVLATLFFVNSLVLSLPAVTGRDKQAASVMEQMVPVEGVAEDLPVVPAGGAATKEDVPSVPE